MAIEIKDSFMMGTENTPAGSKPIIQYDLWIGPALLRLKSKEEVIAFAEWVKNSGNYMEDVGQQANGWIPPLSPIVNGEKSWWRRNE